MEVYLLLAVCTAHKEDAILQKDWEVYTWQNIFDYKMHVLMKQPVEFQAAGQKT